MKQRHYTCITCGKRIPDKVQVGNVIKTRSYYRKYCYDCIPHGQRKKTNKPKLHSVCQRCGREYFYVNGTGCSTKKCISCSTSEARIRKKQKAVNWLGGKCQVCGYNKCLKSLQFHHLDPKTKSYGLSSVYTYGWDKWESELKKCILVCANCHGEIESGLITIDADQT